MSDQSFPFLQLPRELRDQIYHHVFSIPDPRSDQALRIERRNVKYFTPSPATILLICRHDYLLLNRQIAAEALDVLLKRHTVLLSCGPFVLKTLLSKIENEGSGLGKQWLRWMRRVELDWVTFPNLRSYPPRRENARDEWDSGHGYQELDVDNIRGAQYSGYYDEYDCEGEAYDDNLYSAEDPSLYPFVFEEPSDPTTYPLVFEQPPDTAGPYTDYGPPDQTDPMELSAFTMADMHHEWEDMDEVQTADIDSKLEMLVELELLPLFEYLSTPTFALSSITLPLYFMARQALLQRSNSHTGHAMPLKLRYWCHVAVRALAMLLQPSQGGSFALEEVHIKYMPWDVWASMDPSDDLVRVKTQGVWFDEDDSERILEGAAFRAIWIGLAQLGITSPRQHLVADISYVRWEGTFSSRSRVGDQLDVVLRRA